jgi:predicted O-linked N-acetylglucosamine transferase (SPINDLY family)
MTLSSDDIFRQAIASLQAGRLIDAEQLFKKVLRQQPKHFDALNLLAIILMQLERHAEAERYIKSALNVNAKNDATLSNYGIILKTLKRPQEALVRFSQALTVNSANSLTWNNRGTVMCDLNRYEDAVADFDKATLIDNNFSDAFCSKGNSLCQLKRNEEALGAYDKALNLKPDYADAWLGRGNAFYDLKRYDEAFAAYDKALALRPDLENAWLGRGNVFFDLKRYDEAFAAYDKALAIKPDLENAWLGRGNIFSGLKRYDEAFAAYDKALALKPDFVGAEGMRLRTKMHICDWINFDAECAHLISSIKNKKANTTPFSFLAIPSSPEDQLQCAKLYVTEKCPVSRKPIWSGEQYRHDRIRVAYVSADFRQHPVSCLIAGMFECHDKFRFDVTAISFGPDDNSEMRQRLKTSFEHFIDVQTYSDDQIANLVRSSEVDILVDLMGFTTDARTDIFARRAAPIQVNYLGYPGTMGATYLDYVIADQTVIPDECRKFYAEKIAVLPNTYQVNDRKRVISDKAITRSDVGLPLKGFVFCCFNNNYKITPLVFNSWMRILKQVEGSVLWLLEVNASAASNLKKEAVARGVSSERLIFAKRMTPPDHLARHRLADLFLDTLPYNAHTTASDALWAGLPVLTCVGDTFAGRVAASLLNAIGLPELIITTPEAYEQMAIDLTTHPEKLAAIKRKLADNRLTTPLFDTKLFTRHIEAAYTAMYERYQAGLAPDHILIPN